MENYVGKRLDGRYEIQDIIGVGGMAIVYKAYDSIDDRIVAIKILKEEYLAKEEFRRRFKNESKAIGTDSTYYIWAKSENNTEKELILQLLEDNLVQQGRI